MTIREQLETKYGKPKTSNPSGLSIRQQLEAKYKSGKYQVPEIVPTREERISTARQQAEQAKSEADKYRGVGFLKEFGKELVSNLAPSEVGLGKTISKIAIDPRQYSTNISNLVDANNKLRLIIKDKESKGQDTTSLKRAFNQNIDLINQNKSEISKYQSELPTTGQATGQLGGTALDLFSVGTYGRAAQGLKTGVLGRAQRALPSIVPTGTRDLVKQSIPGVGVGYGYDVSLGLQGVRGEDRAGGKALIPGLGTGISLGIPAVGGAYQKARSSVGAEGLNKAINSLEQTYTDILGGTTLGKKRLSKIETKTESLNRAGTSGKTPQRILAENGVIPQLSGTKLDTFEQANSFRKNIEPLRDANRKALTDTGLSTAPVKLDDLERRAIEYARTPQNINSGRASKMEKEIIAEFNILRKEYPSGEIPLTLVDDIKSARWDNVFKNKSLVEADALRKDSEYAIAKSMQKNIEEVAERAGNPEVAQLNREIGDRLDASKFLEELNGKTVKGGRLLKYITTLIGSSLGQGVFGKIIGALGGNVVGDIIISNQVSNPIKRAILNKLKVEAPEAYLKTIQWLQKQELDRGTRLLLPKGNPEAGLINQGRPIVSFPRNVEGSYIGADIATQSKSPTSQQTIPAIRNVSNIPINQTLPQANKESSVLSTLKKALKDQRGFVRNPLATEQTLPTPANKSLSLPNNTTSYKPKRDLIVKDILGRKIDIPEGTIIKVGQGKGSNSIIEVKGQTYTINKGQFDNLKGQSLGGEAKPFAPELDGLEESVRGASKWQGDELYDNGNRLADVYEENGKWHYRSDMVEESPAFKTRKEAMENAEADVLGIYSGNETKYSQYTLPDGKNYKEILIKAPRENISKDIVSQKTYNKNYSELADFERRHIDQMGQMNPNVFKSSHWDEPNVISHLRMNERTYKGKKVAFMEELQSDWAREGRDKGFINPNIKEPSLPEGWRLVSNGDTYQVVNKQGVPVPDKLYGTSGAYGGNKDIAIAKATGDDAFLKSKESGIPNNPNLKNWQVLTTKRALKEAVDSNADYFAWINGDQTSARYNLATYVDEVAWNKSSKTKYDKGISIRPSNKSSSIDIYLDKKGVIQEADKTDWKGKKLDEVLGKGLADKIMEKESGNLSGEGLKFGGEWANNLYDKQVKNIVEDLTGGKVEMLDMGLPIENKKINWYDNNAKKVNGVYPRLNPGDIKVGMEVRQDFTPYIITDILADGKFKAVQKQYWKDVTERPGMQGATMKQKLNNVRGLAGEETFDISLKTTKQMGIKLTPEIKAIVRGESPLKNSGKARISALLGISAIPAVPLIFDILNKNE